MKLFKLYNALMILSCGVGVANAEKAPMSLDDQIFNQELKLMAPMSKEQILKLKEFKENKAKAIYQRNLPKSIQATTIMVDISSGSKTPVIEIIEGFSTSIEVVDITGKPWPIANYTIGNRNMFDASHAHIDNDGKNRDKENGQSKTVSIKVEMDDVGKFKEHANILTITPKHNAGITNAIFFLKGLKKTMSVVVKNKSDINVFYDRITIVVNARSPDYESDFTVSAIAIKDEDPSLVKFLDLVIPKKAQVIKTDNSDVKAWHYNNAVYIRTNKLLINPTPVEEISSSLSINIFKLNHIPSIPLLFSNNDGVNENIVLTALSIN